MKVVELITALQSMPALVDVGVKTDDDHPALPVIGVAWFDASEPVQLILDVAEW